MSGKSGNPTVKERLTCVETKLDNVTANQENHLRHHWQFNMVLLSAISIEAIALLIVAVKHVL